ncbi:MAG TPA: DUF192 domain-containing protein [Solirubrobacteraceae bacterium]|jgi:hypothetical protein
MDGTPARLSGLPGHDLRGGLRVADARSRAARLKGLARLDAMPDGVALHLPRCRSVHTFTMRFPLDLVWLGPDGRAVRVDRSVPPRRLKTCLRARAVVETRAGRADGFLAAGLEDALSTPTITEDAQ